MPRQPTHAVPPARPRARRDYQPPERACARAPLRANCLYCSLSVPTLADADGAPAVYGRDFTSMLDLNVEQLTRVLDAALAIKRDGSGPVLAGRHLALLFEKPSLRTRVSFEVAMSRLGGRALYVNNAEIGMGE